MNKFLITALFLFLPVLSIAQITTQKVEGFISIETRILNSIEIITVNSLTFGNAQPGQGEIRINPNIDEAAGYMIAIGTPGADFKLSFVRTRVLQQIDGDGRLNFTYLISSNPLEVQTTSELMEDDNRNLTFNDEGRYYIWIGGIVNLELAKPGKYEGDFTIEIDYI